MHILMTGGTGFIGKNIITQFLRQKDCYFTILSRTAPISNQGRVCYLTNINEIALDSKFDLIINLAGAPIDQKWTSNYKQGLIDSRLQVTRELIELVNSLKVKPELLINASAIGYYGANNFDYITEAEIDKENTAQKITPDFSHELCRRWEEEAAKMTEYGVRVCIARFGVVLGKDGGALPKITPRFRLALGGKIGTGQQFFSWIHICDVINIINYLVQEKSMQGAFNFTAPKPVTNTQFTKILAQLLQKPALLPIPAFLVKIIFGEMGEKLLLTGNAVYPARLLNSNYQFLFPDLKLALADLL